MQVLMNTNVQKQSILQVEDKRWGLYNKKTSCKHYIIYILLYLWQFNGWFCIFFPDRERVKLWVQVLGISSWNTFYFCECVYFYMKL